MQFDKDMKGDRFEPFEVYYNTGKIRAFTAKFKHAFAVVAAPIARYRSTDVI